MLRAIIADDDNRFVDVLTEVLNATGRVEIVARADNGARCLELLETQGADLLLLDVEMPGVSGVEVAEMVVQSESPPLIVFITGHDEYAAKAFDLRATDYIVKPVDLDAFPARIGDMLDRVEANLGDRDVAIRGLRDRIGAMSQRLDRLEGGMARTVRGRLPLKDYDEGTLVLVPTAEISHVARHGRQVRVHAGKRVYRTNHSIERLADRLAPEGFVRVSSGALVNLHYVNHMIPNGDGSYDVTLSDPAQTVLVASRARSRDLLRLLQV